MDRQMAAYQTQLEGILRQLGRDDIAIPEVRARDDGSLVYVLQKGAVTAEASIAPSTLANPQAAMTQVNLALRAVSKPAEQAHIAKAQQ